MSEFSERAQERRQADEKAPNKRKSLLPSEAPDRSASHAVMAAWATVALGLGEDPIVGATRYGRHPDAHMVITLKSGHRITFANARATSSSHAR